MLDLHFLVLITLLQLEQPFVVLFRLERVRNERVFDQLLHPLLLPSQLLLGHVQILFQVAGATDLRRQALFLSMQLLQLPVQVSDSMVEVFKLLDRILLDLPLRLGSGVQLIVAALQERQLRVLLPDFTL